MNVRSPKIGILPLYLKLYDEVLPDLLKDLQPLVSEVAKRFERSGVAVVRADTARVSAQFDAAMALFRKEDVDCIVALHLAYSPSLEAIEALAGTDIPLLLLDTTPDAAFGPGVDPRAILRNHGVHGVMDLACMLRRRNRPFRIVAGHIGSPATMQRAAECARAAYAARCFRNSRVLRIGPVFAGMGDFAVDAGVLDTRLGIKVDEIAPGELASDIERVTEADVTAELKADRRAFRCTVPDEVHRRSTRVGLGLRGRLERGGYAAFTMNFSAFNERDGAANTVPFLEASKAMARGVGYAGEGDALTAALVGALARAFGATTFTEVFCADWKGGTLFLSHMGEVNPQTLAAARPEMVEKPYVFSNARNPAVFAGSIKAGPATFVNLAPDDAFRLIVAPVKAAGAARHPEMRKAISGWIRPRSPVAAFLEAYSTAGGTHHSALVLGDRTEAVTAIAAYLGIECVTIAE